MDLLLYKQNELEMINARGYVFGIALNAALEIFSNRAKYPNILKASQILKTPITYGRNSKGKIFVKSATPNLTRSNLSAVYFKPSSKDKPLAVLYFEEEKNSTKAISTKSVKENLIPLFTVADQNKEPVFGDIIIITDRGLTSYGSKEIFPFIDVDNFQNPVTLTHFHYLDFAENIFAKAYMPVQFKFWKSSEHKEFEEEEEIKINELNLILEEDKFIRILGLVEDDILMTVLPIPTSDLGFKVDYRRVVKAIDMEEIAEVEE